MIQKTPVDKEIIHPLDVKGVWEGMEECQKLGLTKAIGVSNFSCKKLEEVLSIAKIPPAVNQVSFTSLSEYLFLGVMLFIVSDYITRSM